MKKREDLLVWKVLRAVQQIGIIATALGVTGVVAGACLLRAFGINFAGFEEILVIVAFWLYMLGAGYASYEKSHITADMIHVLMKEGRAKDVFYLVRMVLTTVLSGIFLIWAVQFFDLSVEMGTKTTVFRMPVGIGYASMVVGLGFSTFYNICYTWDALRKAVKGERVADDADGADGADAAGEEGVS
ncbi:MAG: TRAP transporter small permease [Clostridiales Family XIII bacterium]|nr:TRAP transporter small permease [Clostridiales Family XIII bacterium]